MLANETLSPEFEFNYVHEEHGPEFITINLSGGAALSANAIPLNDTSEFLDTYSKMGMGNKAFVEANYELFSGKAGLELGLLAVFKPFVGFLDLSNHSGYAKFQDFPMIEMYDAYAGKDFTDIFETDTNQTGTTASTKQIIYNSINGNIGPGSLNFNGFDYRNLARDNGLSR
jgi:hypothetical protein